VNLVVSLGPVTVSTPDVVGLSQAVAENTITTAGLTSTVSSASSATVPAGNVISQNPNGGTSIAEGSNVDIVVSTGPAIVTVPNVVGSSQTTATNAITAAGLVVGNVTTQNSTTIATGDVISQSPNGGTSLTEGSAVDLVVSLGPVIVTTPNVVGLSQAAAESAITAAGLTSTVSSASSATVPVGNVISQNPNGGSSVAEGSNVNIVVSTGPAIVTVPNVVGSTQTAATSAITAAGLVVGNVTSQNSTTVATGDVISQSPNGGASLTEGSAVDLVVSLGPVLVNTPDVVGLSQAAAESAITSAGLIVGSIGSVESATVAAGDVISQNPNGGTNVAEGSAVDLVISLGPPPPPPAGPVEVFYDSFENGQWNGLWTEDAQNDWFTNTQRATSGSRSAEVDGSASDAQLISIPIDLQGRTQASITFNWYIESGLDTGEYLAFDVSTDGGSSWTEYERLRGNVDSENSWHTEQVELNGISSLRLRFRARMSWRAEDANVDEVRVTVQ